MPDPIHCAPDSALARLAPTMALTGQQEALKAEVLAFCRAHRADDHALFVIEGDAGTGKSLLLNTLFTAIQQAARGVMATTRCMAPATGCWSTTRK